MRNDTHPFLRIESFGNFETHIDALIFDYTTFIKINLLAKRYLESLVDLKVLKSKNSLPKNFFFIFLPRAY
jgi:hypothetical protein